MFIAFKHPNTIPTLPSKRAKTFTFPVWMWWKSIGYGELDSDFGFVLSMHSHFNWCSSTGSHSGFKMGHQLFWLFIHSDSALILLKWRISPYFLESNIASVRVYVVLENQLKLQHQIFFIHRKKCRHLNVIHFVCCVAMESSFVVYGF